MHRSCIAATSRDVSFGFPEVRRNARESKGERAHTENVA